MSFFFTFLFTTYNLEKIRLVGLSSRLTVYDAFLKKAFKDWEANSVSPSVSPCNLVQCTLVPKISDKRDMLLNGESDCVSSSGGHG